MSAAATGAATLAAREAVGTGGLVVGLDVSLAMRRRASAHGVALFVGGAALGVPFHDRRLDGVAASLVLSHLEPYDAALRDMVRILKPHGRLGITAWAGGKPGEFRRLWEETAGSFVSKDTLRDAARQVAPWEEWFGDEAHRGSDGGWPLHLVPSGTGRLPRHLLDLEVAV